MTLGPNLFDFRDAFPIICLNLMDAVFKIYFSVLFQWFCYVITIFRRPIY